MQLVSVLRSGIASAANGYAHIYQRGTAATATCYADFEGFTVLSQPSGGFSLDANGSVEVYVNQVVDVTVADSTGLIVGNFTEGEASPNVEVRSLSFTGTDYNSGASAAGNPTTLQAVLDLIATAFGTTDWNIKISGTTKTPIQWLAQIIGVFTNVKDPTYGAVGDGVTDDTTHIQAALTAAGTPKGIVFFPAGTYRTTAKLTVPTGVHLWGAGTDATFIKIDHATNDTLEYGSGTDTYGDQEIRGLTIDALQANSGIFISCPDNGNVRRVLVTNCTLGSTNTVHTGKLISTVNSGHTVKMKDCYAFPNTGIGVHVDSTGGRLVLDTVIFFLASATFGNQVVKSRSQTRISGCKFDVSTQTSGTAQCVAVGDGAAGVDAVVTGCRFVNGTSANTTAISVTGANIANSAFSESGNGFVEATAFLARVAGLSSITASPVEVFTQDRDMRVEQVTNNANVQLNGDLNGVSLLTRTSNAAGQILSSNTAPPGAHWTIGVLNSSGGAFSTGNISFGTGFMATIAAIPTGSTLANGKTMWMHFRSVQAGGVCAWAPIASQIQLT